MTATTRRTVLRFGKEAEVDLCPTCLGQGSKWIDDGSEDGRPTLVRDLKGMERARALRTHRLAQIWPCLTCQGEGVK